MQAKSGSHEEPLSRKQDELERVNDDETKLVRAEITQIKRAYIKKYGTPKNGSKLLQDDIAEPQETS